MLIIVVYDVSTIDEEGKKRSLKISKICLDYGVRVQLSVFECDISYDQYTQLKIKLMHAIDKNKDSVYLYRISHSWNEKVERLGNKKVMNIYEDTMII